jgi:hypothetical protein
VTPPLGRIGSGLTLAVEATAVHNTDALGLVCAFFFFVGHGLASQAQ